MFKSERTVFLATDDWPESFDRAMDRLAKTMDRVFGSSFMSEVETAADKATRKPKKEPPGFTTPGKLAVDGKIPRWASPWVALIHDNLPNYEISGSISQVQRACQILENLLIAGFVPPNADSEAFNRWQTESNPAPNLSTNESAEAEEVTHGSQDSQTTEETPRGS